MILENPENYRLVSFAKAKNTNKKYDAFLENKKTKKLRRIPFGDINYPQYKDNVPLHLYQDRNHNDKRRRRLYHARHWRDPLHKYSSGWFSWHYLW
jgi:hypothetical protein